MAKRIVIGTRGSMLALWQAEWVKAELNRIEPSLEIVIHKIKTTGDKILDVPLAKVGGKGLFVKEIEESLLRGESDLAVHSMKDVPSELPEGLHLSAICKREDPRDALVVRTALRPTVCDIRQLPQSAKVGTSSLRRACQLRHLRQDLQIETLRGNLDTRLRKLDMGQYDAIILASAGLRRMGWTDRISNFIDPSELLPAVGQGAIGIECRIDDSFINSLTGCLNHRDTSIAVRAERAFLKRLGGGCQVPIAGHATVSDSLLSISGLVGNLKGDRLIRSQLQGSVDEPERLGVELAETLLRMGADELLKEVYGL